MINLAIVETRTQEKAAGATTPSVTEIQGRLVEFAWWMKKQGYSEYTIHSWTMILRGLARRGTNLLDPESVKEAIAQQNWKEGSKRQAVQAYDLFAANAKIQWDPPEYGQPQKLPFIPLETEIDQLIAGCSKKIATLLQTLKETGARVGEAWKLKWIDVDATNNTITINAPEKGGTPRIIKVSTKLIAMLNALPKTSDKVFATGLLPTQRYNFDRQRKKIAHTLQNPRLLQITFHTLRHWKATMEYHRTKDILFVKQLLGHTNINATLIYTHLIDVRSDEYHVRAAKTIDEAKELLEVGFEYVTDMDDIKLFRKRK
jgi:integrase